MQTITLKGSSLKNRKIFIFSVVFTVVVGILIRYFIWSGDHPDQAKLNPPLRIAVNVWPGAAHIFIAEKKGFFLKNGVQVQLRLNAELEQSVSQYKRGEVDGLLDAFSNTILQVVDGIPTKVVYISDYSQSGDVIVGRPEFTSLAGLKGRRVSFERINSFSHIYVLRALEAHGLDESTVFFEMVPPSDVLTALEAGQIDAGHTWEPITSRALAKGYQILSRAGDIPGIITDVISFSAQVIKKRPKEIQAVVKSLLEAYAFVVAHRKSSMRIMAEAEGMSPEEMASGFDSVFHLDVTDNIAAMTRSKKPSSLYGSGQFIIQYLLSRGQLQQIPDLDEMIDARFVKASKTEE